MAPIIATILQIVMSSGWTNVLVNKVLGTISAVLMEKDAVEVKLGELRDRLAAMPKGAQVSEADLRAALAGYHAASDALASL